MSSWFGYGVGFPWLLLRRQTRAWEANQREDKVGVGQLAAVSVTQMFRRCRPAEYVGICIHLIITNYYMLNYSMQFILLRNNWLQHLFCIPFSPDCYPFNTSCENLWVLCLASPLSCAVFGAQHIFYSVSTFPFPRSHMSSDYLAMYGWE